ncbi:pilus assembly protein TadG-related protein [Virgibacillus sp. DJP39]|uniref:pilus assembly protein TadG-related protein n=1 Tax=Virgibacillus sp. DJP39 TaxID=3409790 RepID=UPI003BB5662C
MKIIRELLRKQDGNVLILVSLAFAGLLAITGLVMDGSRLYMTKADLQKVANAAALSGAQELTSNDEAIVRSIVDEVLVKHNEIAALDTVNVLLNDRVKVNLQRDVPLAFSKLFGIETVNIKADATASLGVMGRATGAVPLGVDESFVLEFGEEYPLKVGSGDSEYGNFGILALAGPGAKTYEETFRDGYSEELQVGDIVNTESGNVSGKTRDVVQTRVNSCNDMYARDCDRVILALIYKPYANELNKVKQVQITGFAYFYIKEPMSATDTSITGIFMKRTGKGFADPNAVNRGAYSIKLTE